jgi:hypothetical protein
VKVAAYPINASAKSEPSTPRAISAAWRLAVRAAAVSFARQSASACCRINRMRVSASVSPKLIAAIACPK